MIYLDNAATTFKKPSAVYSAVKKSVKDYSVNVGRGAYDRSIAAAEKIYETRCEVASLLNFDSPEKVIFTLNATYALNLAIKGLIYEKCHVIISDIEHNSVIRPIESLKERLKVEYSVFNSDAESIEAEIESHVRRDTRAIVSTLASNVTGKEIPLSALSKIAVKHNLKLIVDASQYIGHKKIDLKETPCTVLCAPAHKALFGIMGLGFALFSSDDDINTLIEGGSGSGSKSYKMPKFLPERLEAGTLPLHAIVALNEGIKFINSVGIDTLERRINSLTERCCEAVLSVPGAVVYGKNLGIVSFNIKGLGSEFLSDKLNGYGICVRGGLECAPLAHEKLGTLEYGAVRVSSSYFTTEAELYKLSKALKMIVRECL